MSLPTNKNLEDVFNLPSQDVTFDDEILDAPMLIEEEITEEAFSNLEKINNALPQVKGLNSSDTEMQELSDLAKSSFKDLIDLGMQVDSRSAGDILSVAQQFLGHAITAQQAKINKKLKMIDLQLKKAKLDQDTGTDDIETATGTVLDRNELLAQILEQAKNSQDK